MTQFPKTVEVIDYCAAEVMATTVSHSLHDNDGEFDSMDLEYYDDEVYASIDRLYRFFGMTADSIFEEACC